MDALNNRSDAAYTWVKFASELRFEDIPASVLTVATRDIIDIIATTVAGGMSPAAQVVVSQIKEMGGTKESTVFGQGCRLPAPSAAMANGALAHALDFDDVNDATGVHIGQAVVPAAIAVAERKGVSGKELLTAVTLGLEMVSRMADASPLGGRLNWTSQTWGYMGAALAVGRILGLNEEGLVNALGLALGQTSGSRQFLIDRGSQRAVYAGFSAHAGVLAGLLADKGLTAARNSLEGQYGFYKLYNNNDYDPKVLIDGLGHDYMTSRLGFKLYPSCGSTHPYTDAVFKIMEDHDLSPKDVRSVCAHVGRVAEDLCNPREVCVNPRHPNQAQWSIPYVIALAIVKGRVALRDFLTDEFRSPDVLQMAERVTYIVDPSLESRGVEPAIVEIETNTDRYIARVDHRKGSPENPMTDADFDKKLRDCFALGSCAMDANTVDAILETANSLDKVEDIRQLTSLLQ